MFFGPEGRVAAEEHVAARVDWKVSLSQLGQAPLVEVDAAVALDPGEGVLLAHRHQHLVAFEEGIGLAGGHQRAPALRRRTPRATISKRHAGQLAALVHEGLGHVEVDDRDALVHARLPSPRARPSSPRSRCARSPSRRCRRGGAPSGSSPSRCCRRPARSRAGRCCVTWPKETEASQSMPMWMLAAASCRPGRSRSRPRGAPQPTKIASQPCASSAFIESMRSPAAKLHAQVEDVAGLLVDHRLGQAEARDLRADEAAGLGLAVEHRDLVAQRRQVARDGERGRPGADAGDALAVLRRDLAACARARRPSCRRPRA